MKARSLVHVAPRRVEIRDVELQAPGPGEVLVRTVCSGISGGTELLVYRGEAPRELVLDEALDELHGTFSYPFAYGYGCVGRVQGLDEPLFAFHPHQDIFVIRRQALVPLPGVPPRTATLFPLVETALQVTLDAAPRVGGLAWAAGHGARAAARRGRRGHGRAWGPPGHRRQRQPRRSRTSARAAGPRGHAAGRLLAGDQARPAASWRGVSPQAADHPQHPGVDDPVGACGELDHPAPAHRRGRAARAAPAGGAGDA